MPEAIDTESARLTLASLGAQIDEVTPVQRAYLESWSQGS
jgi:S-adenosylhomocysteine hydrolase